MKNKVIRIVFFLLSFTLFGREVKISVADKDLDLPLEGAVIHSWDGEIYFCDDFGEAVITVPDGRQVTLQVTYPGYETGRFAVPLAGEEFTIRLSLGGIMEGKELVIEAQKPGESETRPGRSVAISGETLERTAKIGFIEDVMTSIKLLPGVGYTSMFNAMPSIRGGDPGDLMAVYDGFYIENPYYWGGSLSIFDPNMISSAQLSHGIFSVRYGHSISGILEVTSKKANTEMTELELGISTSAVNLNASIPVNKKGGFMVMGRVTFWDPFVWAVQGLADVTGNETLALVKAVTTAPYIRSAAVNFNYQFTPDLELRINSFIGTDGVGADYANENDNSEVQSKLHMLFDWDNLQTFLNAGLTYTPRPDMVLRATAGAGYSRSLLDGLFDYDYVRIYNPDGTLKYEIPGDYLDMDLNLVDHVVNVQGRVDFDWDLGRGFLLAAGIQELYRSQSAEQDGLFFIERRITGGTGIPGVDYMQYPLQMEITAGNSMLTSSAYGLVEYTSPARRFGAELGLRLDHLYFAGDGFDIQTKPVLNPRLNLDFNVFKNKGIIQSLDITAGSGLFSSVNDAVSSIEINSGVDDFTLTPNRSWTSIIGAKIDFAGGWSFNIEGYYKYVFDRAYQYTYTTDTVNSELVYRFDGDGIVWGFDAMLQKFDSRYFDGWVSYTFTWAKYHESERPGGTLSSSGTTQLVDSGWYYPSFHRFHNINLVLNIKPLRNFNIYTRLGLASGRPLNKTGEIYSYQVQLVDKDGNPGTVITKYRRDSSYDDNNRTTWSIPLDVKLSWYLFNPKNKVQTEIYLAAENLLSLVYRPQGNTTFNQYTGTEDTGSQSASYELPIPMISFGFKWSY
ncbi:TonB-dependent receptor plug domain-containing protein [Brucepastera parasyntrophica]|uniref:TonB-dependent receptor plug domain-containing protein n=1 Tax=Brucepastera parasyntrophica TaxID=2880008 RepID=UPI00210D78A4|nr:TonB-dependent receptor plug domain-containing protein [Brucepastera parasyntrophica]ULQ58864.1 TonB-dependent receptor plug domain-containing protein [Brucepastera parasyntrophica]